MRRGSLKLRLVATGAAAVTIALAIAGFGLLLLFERHVERRITLELESHLRQLIGGLSRSADGSLNVVEPPGESRFAQPLSGFYWQVAVEPDGPVLRSRSLWDSALTLPADHLADGEVHRHTIVGPGAASLLAVERVINLPGDLGGGAVRAAVALDRAEIHAAGLAFAADLAPSLALLGVVLIVAGWLQISVGLKPLDRVRRRLAEVRAGQSARLGTAFPDEVMPLAKEVDRLLDAQERSIERARARAADLAHGLKTPLTVLASNASELRERGEVQLADEIATVADAMRGHVERELALARAGVRARTATPRPVRPVADRVVDVLRRTPSGHALDWELDIAEELGVRIDAQDLTELIGNLAENAAKWARGRVRIAGRKEPGGVLLRIEDDGPGVPNDRIETVLARGGRLDESRPGSGLGLAIVKDLVEAYAGSLSLGRSDLGGLSAELRLPPQAAAVSGSAFDP